jgi:putative aldouronate transport system permease protein
VFLIILALSALLPFANVFSKSVSEDWAVFSGKVGIFPVGFQLNTMKLVVTSKQFLSSFLVSTYITVVGTVLSLLLTAITAYPLSKKSIAGVKTILILYVFTMLFNGGLIPNYLLIRDLNLINNLWSLILPGMISVFNMLIIKNYYESLPESLEESARLDGASNITVMFRIILPLSKPVLATISLFYAVGFWNDYYNAMIYISKPSLKPLQLYLRDVVMDVSEASSGLNQNANDLTNAPPEGIRAATVIAATIPMLFVYPWVQKYFIKGIMIGSVKG